jgi:hypothetical protein
MKRKTLLPGIISALGILLLILDSKTALNAAREGIGLCLQTVVPVLFPFFLLSGTLVRSLMGTKIPLLSPLGAFLGMPKGTESLLIPAFLGGYPVGAGAVREAWVQGQIDTNDAKRLLTFCSNAGPAFVFGMAAGAFSSSAAGWQLWGIHILSAVLTALTFREEPGYCAVTSADNPKAPGPVFQNTISITAQVCGWVIVFRIITVFCSRWFLWLLPPWVQVAITGLLELTNGCLSLHLVEPEALRFVLCSIMLSFGGICVTMQTSSAARGLGLNTYLTGKLLQTCFSLLLSLCLTAGVILPALLPLALPIVKKKVKKGRNPRTSIV